MELLSQLDVHNPDHVSVITREGRVVISVRKDGADVTVGFPVDTKIFNTSTPTALQQTVPVLRETKVFPANEGRRRRSCAARFTPKLTDSTARQIKDMLNDKDIMSKFNSKTDAYQQIGKAYNVSQHTVRQIHLGIAWKHV